MSDVKYTIKYSPLPNVTFSSSASAEKYLREEANAWDGFLELLKSRLHPESLQVADKTKSRVELAAEFHRLIGRLDNPTEFNASFDIYGYATFLPPPSDSLEGKLILSLFENGDHVDALCVYLVLFKKRFPSTRSISDEKLASWNQFLVSAKTASVLPFHKVSSQKMAAAARSAELKLADLDAQVGEAKAINSQHSEQLDTLVGQFDTLAKETLKFNADEGLKQQEEQKALLQRVDDEIAERIAAAEKKLKELDDEAATKQKQREEEHARLVDLFENQLRFRAPVALWRRRAEIHKEQSEDSFCYFVGLTIAAILAGATIPYYFGDYIADSFFQLSCDPTYPTDCARVFSAKGPLTVAGILVIMSLLMWAIRLQYRVYLSERHLSLDASEKTAFAETYLAMREGAQVDGKNEAIVLTSLFRPTQDGIIKDDEGSLDFSAVAILAKQLGK